MHLVAPALDRSALLDRYRRNRRRSAAILSLVSDDGYERRPIPLRHPFVFYDGHMPGFSFLTLNRRALGEACIDAALERLFERGIDPASLDDARRHERGDWPSRAAVADFGRRCDERVLHAIGNARIEDPGVARLVRAQAVHTVLEHELMHHETLLYIVHELEERYKRRIPLQHYDHGCPRNELRTVAAGVATLGAGRDEIAFGWDNEFEKTTVRVAEFGMMAYPVTNGDWLRFVAAGGPVPHFWIERDGAWHLRTLFDEVPLPHAWPAYVTHQQAQAYAAWSSMRLPTEAEFHRAAFGTRGGDERAFPWGDDPPSTVHGNFDFQRYDPEPVDAHPLGASGWGVHDLIGNGWEWTSTPFAPLPGFQPMASYPQYSADFFDGKHYAIKGASPVTSRDLVRRSFRNWFFEDYPYAYIKFRCVAER